MSGKVRQLGGPLPRLGRLLLGRNALRRPCDRIEGAVLIILSAAFLAVIGLAALLAGHVYQSQHAIAARLRPTAAVLSEPGPVIIGKVGPAGRVQARATWRLPDGAQRTGQLTASTAPAVDGARAGTSVTVWLNRHGDLQPPPPDKADVVANTLIAGAFIPAAAALLLTCCYRLCRLALDRHRLARWAQAWAAAGPRWTSRQ
jgi:hypothetical protein